MLHAARRVGCVAPCTPAGLISLPTQIPQPGIPCKENSSPNALPGCLPGMCRHSVMLTLPHLTECLLTIHHTKYLCQYLQ